MLDGFAQAIVYTVSEQNLCRGEDLRTQHCMGLSSHQFKFDNRSLIHDDSCMMQALILVRVRCKHVTCTRQTLSIIYAMIGV